MDIKENLTLSLSRRELKLIVAVLGSTSIDIRDLGDEKEELFQELYGSLTTYVRMNDEHRGLKGL